MTPELEPFERIFRRLAIARDRPWPPDRWLGARARGAFVSARLAALREEAERALDDLVAIQEMHAIVAGELVELLALIDTWCDAGEELARIVAAEGASSPWARVAWELDHD